MDFRMALHSPANLKKQIAKINLQKKLGQTVCCIYIIPGGSSIRGVRITLSDGSNEVIQVVNIEARW